MDEMERIVAKLQDCKRQRTDEEVPDDVLTGLYARMQDLESEDKVNKIDINLIKERIAQINLTKEKVEQIN